MADVPLSPSSGGSGSRNGFAVHRSPRLLGAALPFIALVGAAQERTTLTLARAEAIALHDHPRIAAADLVEGADRSVIAEARASYLPTLAGSLTGAVAFEDTTAAAGAPLDDLESVDARRGGPVSDPAHHRLRPDELHPRGSGQQTR